MTEYEISNALVDVLTDIHTELQTIRKILQVNKAPRKIVIGSDGTYTDKPDLTDLETYFEERESEK